MPHTLLAHIGEILVLLVCLTAMVLGSWRERLGGGLYLAAYALTYLLTLANPKDMTWRFIIGDLICLLGFFYLSWKSPHPWPLWAFGAQLLTVMTEVAAFLNWHVLMRWTFLTVQMVLGYAVLFFLLLGTLAAVRARRIERQKSPN